MSYADLKPVKFEEPDYTEDSLTDQYSSDVYSYQSFFDPERSNEVPASSIASPYPSPYPPTYFPMIIEQQPDPHHHTHHQLQPQPQQQQHQLPLPYNLKPDVVVSQPTTFAPNPPQPVVTFRPPNSISSRKLDTVGRDSPSPNDVSEELLNHWMPMTWIERSSDDPQVFNFVCLWGKCVAISSSKDEFVEHLMSHINSIESDVLTGKLPSEKIVCKVRGCGKRIDGIDELHHHIPMHIFQADCQQKGSEALIEKEDYSEIETCGFDPCTNVNYDGELLVCMWENCGSPFTSLTELFDHVGQHIEAVSDIDRIEQDFDNGEKKNVYPCKWTGCTQVTDSKSNLRRHTRHHSGEKVLACPFCARFFSRRDKLYDHCIRRSILTNDMDDPYVCKLCQKKFGTEKALCMHVTRHLVGHTCPLCSLCLSSRSEIHRHLMTKHSSRTKDFKCDVCNKQFFTESELNRHRVFHSDVMYGCKHCDEKFKWKKQLLKHMKEHDENFNPTPYICHLCDRTYTTGFALGRHLTRQHRLNVPYGFSRFTYKKCADGMMRLQTKKLFRNGTVEEHPVPEAPGRNVY